MNVKLMKFLRDEDGVTAIEYGLIAGLVAVALVVAVGAMTNGLGSIFTDLGTKLTNLGTKIGT
ncbi:Flp family type IVb pilin [Collimonas humicola]|uniref:Flp family type IVb pilin n=1 Tax=Collimonas humicola TaxID=2825886 RepID=UPI001B8C0C4D|nr:Flp family type IVb pilin [Collimonas humicola]